MDPIQSLNNSLWLADGERFNRCIHAAILKPCPSAAQIRERHREWMQLAKDLPAMAVQGNGVDDGAEIFVGKQEASRGDKTGTLPEASIPGEGLGYRTEAPRSIRAVKGKVGVIPIYGPVDQRMSGALDKAGGTPLDFVAAAFEGMLSNQSIGAIVLRFDSPGGTINGVQELADKIYKGRLEKPIYAIADSLAASAALWLASSATMFMSTPGGGSDTVGSHGVYTMHIDKSAAVEGEGLRVTSVYAGKYKTEFSPYGPLSDDAKAELQSRIDDIYESFTMALRRNRNTSREDVLKNYGQGRVMTAQAALSVGMIDRIMSYDELISKLVGGDPQAPATSRGPSAEVLRLRHEKRKQENREQTK